MTPREKYRRVVFISTNSQADACVGNEDTLFIGMTPAVCVYARKKGLPVASTLNYFTNESHKKALETSKIIIGRLREYCDFWGQDLGVRYAYEDCFIFWARFATHYFIWASEVVLNAVAMHEPEVICAAADISKYAQSNSLYIEPDEDYLGIIVKDVADKKEIHFESISYSTLGMKFYWAITRPIYSMTRYFIKYIIFTLQERRILKVKATDSKEVVLFATWSYQMDRFAVELENKESVRNYYFIQGPVLAEFKIWRFLQSVFLPNRRKATILNQVCMSNLIKKIKNEKRIFSYREIVFSDMLSAKISEGIARHVMALIVWAGMLDRFIDRVRPVAVISNGSRDDDVVIAELCRLKNIQSVLISHGSHVKPRNEFESIEWGEHGKKFLGAPFSYIALQTPLGEGYLEAFPSESRAIKTGPLIWGRPIDKEKSKILFKKMFGERYASEDIKIILHAGTPKASNSLRFYVYEAPDEYIQALCDLAYAVEKIPSTVLIIKFRPSKEISIDVLRALVPFSEKVILSVDETFSEVLGMADLLVSFSSTTIEEALQNRIPILLYGGAGRYSHVPSFEIKDGRSIERKAAYHAVDPLNLSYALEEILRLRIDGCGKDSGLFDKFIYPESEKVTLESIIGNVK